ncbi:MAG: nitroreductase family protein [Dehalococcoidia bacterium]|nr:nitroreductase family protein [Dehalococcoidia bacterium]
MTTNIRSCRHEGEDLFDIYLDEELCTQCGLCEDDCVRGVFRQEADGRMVVTNEEQCILCGHCVAICPTGAITHGTLGQDGFEEITSEMDVDPRRLRDLLRRRRSMRAYLERPVPRAVTEELIEMARWAPTGSNSQKVEFTVIEDRDTLQKLDDGTMAIQAETWRRVSDPESIKRRTARVGVEAVQQLLLRLAPLEQMVKRYHQGESVALWGAPALLLAHTASAEYFGRDDCLFATYNFMLGCNARGLGTCLIGLVVLALPSSEALTRLVDLPAGQTVHAACVFGYPRYHHQRLVPRNPIPTRWL